MAVVEASGLRVWEVGFGEYLTWSFGGSMMQEGRRLGIVVSIYLFPQVSGLRQAISHAIAIVQLPPRPPRSPAPSVCLSNSHCSPVSLVYNVVYHPQLLFVTSRVPNVTSTTPHHSLLLVVVRHLQTRPLKTALDIETLVRLRAVKNSLIAANILRNKVQRLNDPQTKLLALLVLCDSDIFNVPNEAEVVDAKKR
jgi:hypothetical protein